MAIDDFVYASYMAALPHLTSRLDEVVRKPELARRLLDGLGEPDAGIPTILVTGSKGKGSVARMISYGLEEMGYRVGLFTGPHLLHFCERIRINGVPIPEGIFLQLGKRVEEGMRRIPVNPLSGEYIGPIAVSLALAYLYFRREGVEVAVLEAGRGGLMDETNQVEHEAAVITPLFEEHLDRFGPSLSDVVRHKLGIVRPGVKRVYIGRQSEAALRLIGEWRGAAGREADAGIVREGGDGVHKQALEALPPSPASMGPLSEVGQEWKVYGRRFAAEEGPFAGAGQEWKVYGRRFAAEEGPFAGAGQEWKVYGRHFAAEETVVTEEGTRTLVRLGRRRLAPIRLPLLGDYQGENMALALQVVRDFTGVEEERLSTIDFSRFTWPGRGEILRRRPLVLLDGAIHPSSAKSLLTFVQGITHSRLHLLLSLPTDKDLDGLISLWGKAADRIITTETTNTALHFADPTGKLRGIGLFTRHIPHPTEAYFAAKEGLDEEGVLVLMGTQSFVADMLRIPARLR